MQLSEGCAAVHMSSDVSSALEPARRLVLTSRLHTALFSREDLPTAIPDHHDATTVRVALVSAEPDAAWLPHRQ